MAGKKPGFLTGANAVIMFGAKTIAYAANVSYRVDVEHVPVYAMGKMEAHAWEPVAYTVSGSLDMIRYTKNPAGVASAVPEDVNVITGNPPSEFGVGDHLNPDTGAGGYLDSTTVDITIHQTQPDGKPGDAIITLRDCRLTRRSIALSKRSLLVESYSFVGELMNDDSQVVGYSGYEDQA